MKRILHRALQIIGGIALLVFLLSIIALCLPFTLVGILWAAAKNSFEYGEELLEAFSDSLSAWPTRWLK